MARILVLSNLYPPHHYGGYELSCRDVVTRWRRRGHTVDVLTSDIRVPGVGGDATDADTDAEVGVTRNLRASWVDHRFRRRPLPLAVRDERRNLATLRAALASTDPEVVSVWNLAALPLSLVDEIQRAGIPTVLVVCNEWPDFWPRIDPWRAAIARRPRRTAAVAAITGLSTRPVDLGRSAAACFVSDALRRRAPVGSAHTPVVYSGIDPGDFPVDDVPRAASAWQWRLLYVGRIDRDKGIETAIGALAHLPADATLRVVGDGNRRDREQLESLAGSLGVGARVTFAVCDRSRLAAVYRGADVVVFPSVWDEPFGLVPLEAMACATPVLATGTGGSAEYLDDGRNALLFPVGDAGALAEAVTRLADDPDLRERLRAGGLVTARAFDVDRLADELEAWHLAAAAGFVDGVPPARPSPVGS